MRTSKTARLLKQALLEDGPLSDALYEFELEELVPEFAESMQEDQDEYLFAVTVNAGDVAMVLLEQSGAVLINEQARTKLRALWLLQYDRNMKTLIPDFARQLDAGEIPITGVKTIR